jgi:hypothetical protein
MLPWMRARKRNRDVSVGGATFSLSAADRRSASGCPVMAASGDTDGAAIEAATGVGWATAEAH